MSGFSLLLSAGFAVSYWDGLLPKEWGTGCSHPPTGSLGVPTPQKQDSSPVATSQGRTLIGSPGVTCPSPDQSLQLEGWDSRISSAWLRRPSCPWGKSVGSYQKEWVCVLNCRPRKLTFADVSSCWALTGELENFTWC